MTTNMSNEEIKAVLLEEIAKTYNDEPRNNVVSMRLSRAAAANLKNIGGAALLNLLLCTKTLPTLYEVESRLCIRRGLSSNDGSDGGDTSCATTNISAGFYHSQPYFRWTSERIRSTQVITLGVLRKMFMVKGLVNRDLIEGNIIFASSNMIDRIGAPSIARFYREGEVIEPWVYLGSERFIRLYQLLYFLKSSVVDDLPDTVIYSDDVRVPVIPILPFDGDVTAAIEISNGGRIDVSKNIPSKYKVSQSGKTIRQLNLFGEEGVLDYGCLPFEAAAFYDMHPDLNYVDLFDRQKTAKTLAETSWHSRVTNLSAHSIIGVKNIMFRGDVRTKPWSIQQRVKGSRTRQYLGSYQYLNDAVYAALQYRFVSDILDEADSKAQAFVTNSAPIQPVDVYITEWANRFNKSQQSLRSWIANNEEYDHHVKGVILLNRERLDSLLQEARKQAFVPINDASHGSEYSSLETLYNYESKWGGSSIARPFYDERLFHLALQGVGQDELRQRVEVIQEGGSEDLPRLFPEYSFKDEIID